MIWMHQVSNLMHSYRNELDAFTSQRTWCIHIATNLMHSYRNELDAFISQRTWCIHIATLQYECIKFVAHVGHTMMENSSTKKKTESSVCQWQRYAVLRATQKDAKSLELCKALVEAANAELMQVEKCMCAFFLVLHVCCFVICTHVYVYVYLGRLYVLG